MISKVFSYAPMIILLIFFVSITSASIKSIRRIREIQKAAKERENIINEIKEENELLKEKMQMEQSQEFIEKEIRNKLNYTKEDEAILVLPPDAELERFKPRIYEEDVVQTPNWKKWAWMFDIKVSDKQ